MRMGIQEKTCKDIESRRTGKCNIPMYANGYQDWHKVPSKKTESRQL